jgi:hypothetical protein
MSTSTHSLEPAVDCPLGGGRGDRRIRRARGAGADPGEQSALRDDGADRRASRRHSGPCTCHPSRRRGPLGVRSSSPRGRAAASRRRRRRAPRAGDRRRQPRRLHARPRLRRTRRRTRPPKRTSQNPRPRSSPTALRPTCPPSARCSMAKAQRTRRLPCTGVREPLRSTSCRAAAARSRLRSRPSSGSNSSSEPVRVRRRRSMAGCAWSTPRWVGRRSCAPVVAV